MNFHSNDSAYRDISNEEIEGRAHTLLQDYAAWSESEIEVPVSVEIIAEQYLGYEIDITDEGLFQNPDYLGGIVFDEKVIRVNTSVEAHEGRYNFTIAHEIGHHVLHLEQDVEDASNQNYKTLCLETGENLPIEKQANLFAASLLMPGDFVRAAYARIEEGSLPSSNPTTSALRALAARVVEMGGFTNVSNTAMVNRLIDLRLVSGARYQTGTPWDYLKLPEPAQRFLSKSLRRTLFRWIRSLGFTNRKRK